MSLDLLPAFLDQGQALCAEVDEALFFPEVGGDSRAAKSICARCELRVLRLLTARANGPDLPHLDRAVVLAAARILNDRTPLMNDDDTTVGIDREERRSATRHLERWHWQDDGWDELTAEERATVPLSRRPW